MATPGGPAFGAFEALAVAGSAVGFTTATIARRRFARVMVEGGAVRVRVDGNDPSVSVGTPVEIGDQIIIDNREDLINFRAIRRDGVSATLSSHFGQ